MVLDEVVRLAVSYSHPNGSTAQNVFYWILKLATATDTEVMTELVRWINSDWGPDWASMGHQDSQIILGEADIVNLDGTVDRNIGQQAFAIAGLGATDGASPGVAFYMQATTDIAKALGKKYVPYVDESAITDGKLIASALANLVLAFAEYIKPLTPAAGASLKPGVVSRPAGPFREFNGGGLTTDIPAYQRRRKPNVGS